MEELHIRLEAEERLTSAVDLFENVAMDGGQRPEALHDMIVAMHSVCGALTHACAAGVEHARIGELSVRARRTAAHSPFVRRLQTWPRGYPGDFETIEYIMQARARIPEDTRGYLIELHSLNTGIVQQHRNKVAAQAVQIARAVREAPHFPVRILVFAAGSSPDVASVLPELEHADVQITLVDSDAGAISYSLARLASLGERIDGVVESALKAVPIVRSRGPFDLVVAGGLFDYLPTKVATALLRSTVEDLLAEGGTVFFTNMNHPNPYSGWMRYVANWRIIERTRGDIESLVQRACGDGVDLEIETDGTELALLVRCTRHKHRSDRGAQYRAGLACDPG